jgi:hypothetical protein
MYVSTVPVVIASSGTVSTTATIKGGYAGAVILPGTLTGTALKFKVSADGTTFTDLYDTAGSQISYTVAASRIVALPKDTFGGFPFIQLVSGSAEAADRTLIIVVRAG